MTGTDTPLLPPASFLTSADGPDGFPPDSGREVVFAGRSNCGKSTAINALTNRRALARTSKTPGRTQLINFFELQGLGRLADLPGYGYARVPAETRRHWAHLMTAYFDGRHSLEAMMLIIDSRRGLKEDDQRMLEYALARDLTIHVLLSKADKLSRSEGARVLANVRRQLRDHATVQLFSGLKRTGLDEARRLLLDWFALPAASVAACADAPAPPKTRR